MRKAMLTSVGLALWASAGCCLIPPQDPSPIAGTWLLAAEGQLPGTGLSLIIDNNGRLTTLRLVVGAITTDFPVVGTSSVDGSNVTISLGALGIGDLSFNGTANVSMTLITVLPSGASVGSKLYICTGNRVSSRPAMVIGSSRGKLVPSMEEATSSNVRATPRATWIRGGKRGSSS